jgi:hypothetical protein
MWAIPDLHSAQNAFPPEIKAFPNTRQSTAIHPVHRLIRFIGACGFAHSVRSYLRALFRDRGSQPLRGR